MEKKWKLIPFVLMLLLCMGLDYGGWYFTSRYDLPFWLDSVGTVAFAILMGPVCGAILGGSMNVLYYVISGDSWIYGLVGIEIGVVVGIMSRKRRMVTIFDMLNVAAVIAIGATLIALPLNVIFSGGRTGNLYGDAVIGFLQEQNVPLAVCVPVGQLYVEMLDKVTTMLLMYLLGKIMHLIRHLAGKKKRRREELLEEMKEAASAAGVLIAALCLAVSPCEADGESAVSYNDYVQTVFARQNGLPVGEANDIAQTKDGILWVGTYAGLYRYNGREFRRMDYDSARSVNCLYEDEEGRLWIGTNDAGLSIAINEEIVNVLDKSHGLPANSVRAIIRSSDGYYYIGTTSAMQIMSLDNGMKKLNALTEVSGSDDLAADEQGHVAAISSAGTLFLLEKGQIVCSRQLPGREFSYRGCTFDSQGRLLASTTGNEIILYDISAGWFQEQGRLSCGKLRNIKDLKFFENGCLFVAADNGIGYFDKDMKFEIVNTNDFSTSIDHMLMDYQGNLWFTSSRLGLLRLASSDFRDIYTMAGMNSRVVNTTVFWQGICYVGTDKGMDAVHPEDMTAVSDSLTEQFSGVRIRCMMVDSRGNLWVCTYSSGVVEIDPDGTQYVYNRDNSGVGNQARVVTELSDGTIIAAGDTGLSFIRDHQVEDTILYAEGRVTAKILTVTELGDGRVLAGTDGEGLAVLRGREVEKVLTDQDGLTSTVILRTVRDTAGGGVFVVASNGLNYMDTDDTIRSLDNFPYFNNYDIFVKDQDTLFVMSSAGIYVVDRQELLSGRKDIHFELLDSRRGLNSSLTANSWTWYDGNTEELYLACDSGVYVIDTNHYSGGTKAYRMNVQSISVDEERMWVDRYSPILLPRGSNRVDIFPEVINYTIQDPNVGYYLEGFDKNWTILSQNSLGSISYTNLPAGTYTFHLAVFNNSRDSIIAERTYTVIKEKELYDNAWFIFYILSVPMLTVGWVTWLMVKRHERIMEAKLAEAQKLVEMGKQTVIAIARTVDAKDPRTGGHSKRVALYSKQIAEEYGLSEKECQEIEWSAQMHDIGKIAIPDSILNKPGRLTDEEYKTMQQHTIKGAEILSDFTLLDHVIEGAEFHHERFDGRGYPKGLKGEDIPLYARIIGVADAFDAMTANRVYRKQMDFSYVLNELEKGSGTQFDPKFAEILLQLVRNGTIDLNKIYHVPREEESDAASETAGTAETKSSAPSESGNTAEAKNSAPAETAGGAEMKTSAANAREGVAGK